QIHGSRCNVTSDKSWATFWKGIVKVGEGRGFIVQYRHYTPPFKGERIPIDERVIITAAHCLPELPPPSSFSHTQECSYKNLLGTLAHDFGPHNVWATCMFVDPIADIAILCGPDSQQHSRENDAYLQLVGADVEEDAWPVFVIKPPAAEGRVWIFAL